MGRLLPALLVVAIPACAAAEPEPSTSPVFEATCGDHRLRFVNIKWPADAPRPSSPPALRFELLSGPKDTLVSRRPGRVVVSTASGARVEPPSARVEFSFADNFVVVSDPWVTDDAGAPNGMSIELTVLRVSAWKTEESDGLMDAGLDELAWPPFLLRFAGEGEAAWLGVTMAERDSGTAPAAAALEEHLDAEYAAGRATVRDAKGRDLIRNFFLTEGDAVNASFAVHALMERSDGDPSIAYPVTVRLAIPAKWEAEVLRFDFPGLTWDTAAGFR